MEGVNAHTHHRTISSISILCILAFVAGHAFNGVLACRVSGL